MTAILYSCNNENDDIVTNNMSSNIGKKEIISGALTPDNPSQSIQIGKTKVEFYLVESSSKRAKAESMNILSASSNVYGPFYSQGTPKIILNKKTLAISSTKYGIPQGVYVCDIYKTSNSVTLPSEAFSGKIGFPNPAGLKSYAPLQEGVNWSLSTTSNNQINIEWYFYTILIRNNMGGASIGKVIPLDGAKVQVPYYYIVP